MKFPCKFMVTKIIFVKHGGTFSKNAYNRIMLENEEMLRLANKNVD